MAPLTLSRLCRNLPDARLPPAAGEISITRVRDDSRKVESGDLFVAIRGASADGSDHAAEAAARGAAAIVVESDDPDTGDDTVSGLPAVRVADARIAVAELAAASFGYPADRLNLVGITGTVGKTSVLAMLSDILEDAGVVAGSIGSLGIRYPGADAGTPNTTPGAVTIQEALNAMVAAGVSVAAMEVTSHALVQQRVHGLRYDLGVFTNLTMLEHLEYHGSFREYAHAKLRFFDTLAPDAPLCYAAGNRAVRQAARRHRGPRISCGGGGAWIGICRDALSLRGTGITLNIRRPLPRLHGPDLDPCRIPLQLRTLGRHNTINATLAAAAGLVIGASTEAVQAALARLEPPRRRLEVIRDRAPIIIDDTVGHPDSITGVFELIERVRHDRLRVVYCIRGKRGENINVHDAEAVAIWSRRVAIDALHVTAATDTADDRNVVSAAERNAFLNVLRNRSVEHAHHDRLADAIAAALDGAGETDIVLLLGAQGMDAGADIARRLLDEPAGVSEPLRGQSPTE
jgi:UDP-N-acetylmuramoyl-L-alanyl-D-glutamate--2,6-diaminopimelate ligase